MILLTCVSRAIKGVCSFAESCDAFRVNSNWATGEQPFSALATFFPSIFFSVPGGLITLQIAK